jgi:hypothetical protein
MSWPVPKEGKREKTMVMREITSPRKRWKLENALNVRKKVGDKLEIGDVNNR